MVIIWYISGNYHFGIIEAAITPPITTEDEMNTAQHRKAIDKLTDDFAALIRERREVERQHRSFQTAFKNPFSDDLSDLNRRWDSKLTEIRRAVNAAIKDGVRKSTVSRWLDCVGSWNGIQDIQRWDCQ